MEDLGLNKSRIQVHVSDNILRCSYCQKLLSSKQSLREHNYTHTGERPYKCLEPGCTKSFRQGSLLTIHRKAHLGSVINSNEPYTHCSKSLFPQFAKIVEKNKEFNWFSDTDQVMNVKRRMNKSLFEFVTHYLD